MTVRTVQAALAGFTDSAAHTAAWSQAARQQLTNPQADQSGGAVTAGSPSGAPRPVPLTSPPQLPPFRAAAPANGAGQVRYTTKDSMAPWAATVNT